MLDVRTMLRFSLATAFFAFAGMQTAHADLPGNPMERMRASEVIVYHTPDKYLACQKDNDCISVMYACGSWAITNKAMEKEFTEAANTVSAAIRCSPTAGAAAKIFPVCHQNRCVNPSAAPHPAPGH